MGNKSSSVTKPKKIKLTDKNSTSGISLIMNKRTVNDYETFYNQLVKVPDDQPVDIIITTHGGSALWCSKICYVLINRKGLSRIFVKSYAHSAGTAIALAGSELYITTDTTLSAIDTQGSPLSDLFHTSIKNLPEIITDPRKAMVNICKERSDYFRNITEQYVNTKLHNKENIMKHMHDNAPIHEQLFFKEELRTIGIQFKIWNGKEEDLPMDVPMVHIIKE